MAAFCSDDWRNMDKQAFHLSNKPLPETVYSGAQERLFFDTSLLYFGHFSVCFYENMYLFKIRVIAIMLQVRKDFIKLLRIISIQTFDCFKIGFLGDTELS